MTPAEMFIVALVYVGTLLVVQRAAAFVLPDMQEICFAVAAVVGSILAGFLYHRRRKRAAPAMVVFSAGSVMAVLALVVGELSQLLWQPFSRPFMVLTIAAFATLLLPFALFRVGRSVTATEPAVEPLAATHVILVAVAALGLSAIAAMLPAPGHSAVRLVPQNFPSLTISLPDWPAEEKSARYEAGTVRLADPAGGDHFLSLRWADSEPVQPDEYVKVISAGTLEARERLPAIVCGHEGATFHLLPVGSAAGTATEDVAIATIWYCPPDHRVLWIITHLAGPRDAMLATHQRILDSVHCHTGEGKPTAAASKIFPAFAPPPGYARDPSVDLLRYVGPRQQTIVFDAAVPGRSGLVDAVVSPDLLANLLKSSGTLTSIDGAPQSRKVSDLLGHQRRVWSATGTAAAAGGGDGGRVQVEVMVWWCDRRDMTFVGTYAAPGTHDPNEGINALLPAVCHQE